MMEYNFFALISRMKYIDRWALMRNNREENLCEHCLEVSMIAHALATIGNVRYGKTLNAERAAHRSLSRCIGDHHRRHADPGEILQR